MSGRILVVDDLAVNRILLQARLTEARYDPIPAADGAECLRLALVDPERRPDLILMTLDLPDMPGDELLRRLRADAVGRDIPVIGLVTGTAPDARLRALAAGADDVIARPVADRVLLARLRNLLRARGDLATEAGLAVPGLAEAAAPFEPAPAMVGTIALVTETPEPAQRLCQSLAPHLRDRLVLLTPDQALDQAAAGMADVFAVLACGEGTAGALRLVSDLKSRLATRHAAVCLLGLSPSEETAAMAFDLGVDDLAGPDIASEELALRLRGLLRRKRSRDRQRVRVQDGLRLALHDPLTGLYNRRHAVPHLRAMAGQAAESGRDFAVMVIDLDRFKTVNDQHGHAAGDAVLVEIGQRLSRGLRDGDLLARIGGEEFLVALPDTSLAEARAIAERLCHLVKTPPIRLPSGRGLRVTVSIGVAVSDLGAGSLTTVDAVVEAADQALLAAKGAGRNQVTSCQSAA